MPETWCVWSKIPRQGQGTTEGWSRVTGGLTQEAAEQYAAVSFFQSRAMPDSSVLEPE